MQVRKIELARATWGAALLIAPQQVLERVHHLEVDSAALRVARILGARHIAQAVLSGLDPSPEVLAMGVWVDGAHAASAVGLAGADRHRARAGVTDAAVAAVWAAIGYRDLAGAHATSPQHDRRRDMLARAVLGIAPGGGRLRRMATRARARGGGNRA